MADQIVKPPETIDAVTAYSNNLKQTPGQLSADLMQGTDKAQDMSGGNSADSQANQTSSGGYGLPGMQQAIADRSQKKFNTAMGGLQSQATLKGTEMNLDNLAKHGQNAERLINARRGVQVQQGHIDLLNNQATYNTVAGLMKGAGSLGGAFAGGREESSNDENTMFDNPTYDETQSGSDSIDFSNMA